jgi:hypothetical protein
MRPYFQNSTVCVKSFYCIPLVKIKMIIYLFSVAVFKFRLKERGFFVPCVTRVGALASSNSVHSTIMSSIPPPFDWSKWLECNWCTLEGIEKLRRLIIT